MIKPITKNDLENSYTPEKGLTTSGSAVTLKKSTIPYSPPKNYDNLIKEERNNSPLHTNN